MRIQKVLFVCLGNICRSPAAEVVFLKYLHEKRLKSVFSVDSAGLIGFHQGELADERMRDHASRRGYRITHRSRQIRTTDFSDFDLILAMDDDNIEGLTKLARTQEFVSKIKKLTDFKQKMAYDYVPDPYYGEAEDFELVLDIVEDACSGLLVYLTSESEA